MVISRPGNINNHKIEMVILGPLIGSPLRYCFIYLLLADGGLPGKQQNKAVEPRERRIKRGRREASQARIKCSTIFCTCHVSPKVTTMTTVAFSVAAVG